MLKLEEIDKQIKELEKSIEIENKNAHTALNNRMYEAARAFATRADMYAAQRDALMWVCGEIPAL